MNSSSVSLSVVILTYNEEIHIERCITKLKAVTSNIYIVDSHSTDQTVSIATSLGATVLQNTWINYSQQFQWALDNCPITTDWIMRIDADEYPSQALIDDINNKLSHLPPSTTGVFVNLGWYFLGKFIRHGGRYPVQLLRLWRTGKAHIEQRWMDEHLVLDEGNTIRFNSDLYDHNLNTVGWFINKHNNYASREMLDIINQKHHLFPEDKSLAQNNTQQAKIKRFIKENLYNRLPVFVRPTLYFIYRYFLRLGFLDGAEGFAYHFMQGFWYRCLIDLKALEADKLLMQCKTKNEKIKCLAELTGLNL